MLTGKVRQAVRTGALVDRDPAQVLRLVNRVHDRRLRRDVRDRRLRARPQASATCCISTSPPPATPPPSSYDGTGRSSRCRWPAPCSACSRTRSTPTSRRARRRARPASSTPTGSPRRPGHRARFGDDRMRQVLEDTGACHASAQVESVAIALSAHLRDRAHDDIAILAVQSSQPVTVDVAWADRGRRPTSPRSSRGDRPRALGQVRGLRPEGYDVLDADPSAARARPAAGRRAVGLRHVERRAGARRHRDQRGGADLSRRRARAAAGPAGTRRRVVVSCVEQEWHALPALMVTEHLRARGLPVSYLGANSSAPGLVRHVHELGPARGAAQLLALGASCPWPAARSRRSARPARRSWWAARRSTPTAAGPGSSARRPSRPARAASPTWSRRCRPPYPLPRR